MYIYMIIRVFVCVLSTRVYGRARICVRMCVIFFFEVPFTILIFFLRLHVFAVCIFLYTSWFGLWALNEVPLKNMNSYDSHRFTQIQKMGISPWTEKNKFSLWKTDEWYRCQLGLFMAIVTHGPKPNTYLSLHTQTEKDRERDN